MNINLSNGGYGLALSPASAINVVLAHRTMQLSLNFKPADSENRGLIASVAGWDGK